jgi:tetratricopeptide (TPR) repeat protein
MMSTKQKIEAGMKLKEEGNQHVKEGEYRKACRSYRRVFGCINGLISKDNEAMAKFSKPDDMMTDEDFAQVTQLKSVVYSNLALCYLKLKEFDNALEQAEKAIEFDKNNIKALHRKGIACNELGLWEKGKDALMTAIKLEPNNAAVKAELQTWKIGYSKWAEEQRQKEKQAFGGKLMS